MKRIQLTAIILILILIGCAEPGQQKNVENLYPYSSLQEVLFSDVRITDDFWLPKIRLVQDVTIPHLLDIAEAEGKIDNFRVIAGLKNGRIKLYNAGDSDVYKLIEAAGYSFITIQNRLLESRIDSLIEIIAAAQLPDGYLNTQFSLPDDHPSSPDLNVLHARRFGYGLKDRWNSTLENWPYAYSQLYCFGHLMEAAVAYYRGTGKSKLLDVAYKMAGHLRDNFPVEKIMTYADHPQVEIGLIKLYEVSADPVYLDLADKFTRYVTFARPRDINLAESSKPLEEQREAWSHAVRTGYIYSAATDVVRAMDAKDLNVAVHSIWNNLTGCKMYIHGGVGNGTKFEQHGHDYDLPILNTYSESCANIAQGQWNHRLNLLSGQSKYADIVEIESYNAALAGYGADGKTFLYSNKLNIDTLHRVDYHSGVRTSYLFCCPSKLPGFITGIGRWIYAGDQQNIYINLFVGSEVNTTIGNEKVSLTLDTDYPWDGNVRIKCNRSTRSPIGVFIRIPAWNTGKGPIPDAPYYFGNGPFPGYSIQINGEALSDDELEISEGYMSVMRRFKRGDEIEINFEMSVRRVYTDTVVEANLGRVALMKGPVFFTLEGADNNFDVLKMVLPPDSEIITGFDPELLGGVSFLTGKGISEERSVIFKAVPYFAWQNRGIFQMCTLIIEDSTLVRGEQVQEKEYNTDG